MRRRLIAVSVAVASLTVIAFLVPLGLLVRQLAHDRALTGAQRDAQLIAFVTAAEPDDATLRRIVGEGEINGNALTIVFSDGRTIGAPLPPDEDLEQVFSGAAGRQEVPGGEAVYAPAIGPDGSVSVVRVLVAGSTSTRGVVPAWLVLGLLGLALVVIAVLVADRLGRTFVRPIEDLSAAATRLGGGDLSTRIDPQGPPEIREVGAEFNRLAERVGRLLESERETAADLSHRLRTPLAALGLDAEGLPSGADRERILDDLAELERAVDFVIREVRRPERHDAAAASDLGRIVAERAAFWEALAEEQGRKTTAWTPDRPGPLVGVPAEDVVAAIDALVGNVFSHTPEGTTYALGCEVADGAALLVVDDAGPGFGAESLERGRSGRGSTGLGLDIARRTAEAAGGSLTIGASPLGGSRVVLTLGEVVEAPPS